MRYVACNGENINLSINRKTLLASIFVSFLILAQIATHLNLSVAEGEGGTLHVAMTLEPDTFNVYTSTLAVEDVFINAFYDTLAVEGLDFAMHPKLATSWSVSADRKVWTANIVNNATFSDNRTLTAEDVKYSYDLAGMPEIDHVDVVDNYTIKFYFKDAYIEDYILRSIFANYYGKVLPKHIWANVSDPYSYRNREAIGSGPWILDTWVEGQYIKMRANPNYWGGRPKLDYVLCDFIKTLDTQVMSLQRGDVDVIYVDPSFVAPLIGMSNINLTIRDQLIRSFVSFNLNRYPISVKEFRHALAYALDTDTLARDVLYGFATPGTQGWCSPATPTFYNPNITKYPYNLTRANEILDGLGWQKGSDGIRSTNNGTKLEFDLLTPSDTPTTVREGEFIRDQFANIGVKLNVVTMSSKTVISREFSGDYHLALMGWFSISVEPTVDMRWHFLAGAFFNVYGYDSSEFNRLFDEYKAASTFAEYKDKIFQMQEILSEDLPILIHSFGKSINAYRTDKFEGWVIPDISDDTLQGIVNWYSLQYLHLQTTGPQPSTGAAIPDWVWWVVIGVVIVAAVIVVGYIAVSRRKKTK
jgi:peptide/nickel transport system substrate-binding protein